MYNELGWSNEVSQGKVGDCYFIASIIALGLRPDLVKDMFVQTEANRAGVYTLKLYVRGKPWLITLDDSM